MLGFLRLCRSSNQKSRLRVMTPGSAPRVQSSVDDPRPNVAHDEVMAQLKARRATKGRVLNTREIIVHPNYLVIYRLTDRIEILSVLHARQQYP